MNLGSGPWGVGVVTLTSHNDLSGIQGGAANEFFHLTNGEHLVLTNVAEDRLLGRAPGGGAGNPQEITLGTNLSLSGTTLNATGGGGGLSAGEVEFKVMIRT